jgi:hypothetical protein
LTVRNFRPAIWSKVILAALQKRLVYGSPIVVNSDYEGDISGPGDTVHITQFGDPEVSSYSPGGRITYQPLNGVGEALIIDQAKSFSFASMTSTAARPPVTCNAIWRPAPPTGSPTSPTSSSPPNYTLAAASNMLGTTSAPSPPSPTAWAGTRCGTRRTFGRWSWNR